MSLTTLNNKGQPFYYPNPKLKVTKCFCWTIFYSIIWVALGSAYALTAALAHTVVFPIVYMASKKFRCSFTYFHFMQSPFLNHENPKIYNLHGARNLYIRHLSTVDHCNIDLGVWHVLPKSVCKKDEEFLNKNNASKEDINTLFDEELMNTDAPIFLYCHGITQSRAFGHRVELYNVLQNLDAHVIAFDYRGFADSTLVVPSKMGMVEDTLVVYSWLRNLVGSQRPVFVWAHSIGTGIALKAFSKLDQYSISLGLQLPPPTGLVLEGSFNNIYEALDYFPFAKLFNWMPHYHKTMVASITRSPDVRIIPEKYVRTLTSPPILMLHSRDDDFIPYQLASKLYGHISQSRKNDEHRPIFKWFPTGGHMLICREKALPGVVENFIHKFK